MCECEIVLFCFDLNIHAYLIGWNLDLSGNISLEGWRYFFPILWIWTRYLSKSYVVPLKVLTFMLRHIHGIRAKAWSVHVTFRRASHEDVGAWEERDQKLERYLSPYFVQIQLYKHCLIKWVIANYKDCCFIIEGNSLKDMGV